MPGKRAPRKKASNASHRRRRSRSASVKPRRNKRSASQPRVRVQTPRHSTTRALTKIVAASAAGKRVTMGRLSDASMRALSIMLPHGVPPRRNNTLYGGEPTAVAAPFVQYTDTWSSAAPEGEQYHRWPAANGRYMVALSRSPLNAAVRYLPNHSRAPYDYRAYFVQHPTTPLNGADPSSTALAPAIGVNFHVRQVNNNLGDTYVSPLPIAWAADRNIGSPGFHPHGDRLYAGDHNGRRGIWLDGGAKAADGLDAPVAVSAEFLFPPHPSGGCTVDLQLNVYTLVGESWVMSIGGETGIVNPSTPQLSTIVYNPPAAAYYSFEVEITAVSGGDYTVHLERFDINGEGAVFAHTALPFIHDKATSLQQMLITGGSMMISPLAPLLYRTGRVACKQLPRGQSWEFMAEPYDRLAESNGAETMDLNKGAYGFLKPNASDCFIPTSPFVVRSGVLVDVRSDLLPPAGWMVMSAVVPLEPGVGAVAPYPSGATYTTLAWQIEFSTTDNWFAQALPPAAVVNEEAMVLAMVRDAPQFHCNPFHFSDLTRWVSKAASALWSNAPSLLGAIGTAIPEAAPFTKTAAGLVKLLQG